MPDIAPFIVGKRSFARERTGDKILGEYDDLCLLRQGFLNKVLGFAEICLWRKLLDIELHYRYFYMHIFLLVFSWLLRDEFITTVEAVVEVSWTTCMAAAAGKSLRTFGKQ